MTREAEAAIIGAILLDPESIRFAIEHVTPSDFDDTALGAAFGLLLDMRKAGTKIDPLSLVDAAAAIGQRGLDHGAILDLYRATPTSANIDYYAQSVASDAVKRRITHAGLRLAQVGQSGVTAQEAMTVVRDSLTAINARPTGGLEAKPLSEILAGSEEYRWLIPGLLERRDRLVLTGGEGAGKTTFVRQFVLAAAAGLHPLHFTPIDPVRVLVVDAENSEAQWRRKGGLIARIAARRGTVDPSETVHVACVARLDITTDRDLASIHALIDTHQPDLVAIGPLYKLVPRAITSDDDAAPLIDALDSLRARDVALVMEAHAGHTQDGTGQRDLRPRGSSALLGWPEFGMGLRLKRDEKNIAELVRWRGDRDERDWPERLRRSDGSGWPWVDDSRTPQTWSPSGAHENWS